MIRLDADLEVPVYSPVCSTCRRFRTGRPGRTCDAFPDAIPLRIWTGANDHRRPVDGDHGLQYLEGPPHDLGE